MLGQDGVLNLRDDRVVVPEDAGEQRFAGLQRANQVPPHLGLDVDDAVTARLQVAERSGLVHEESIRQMVYYGVATVSFYGRGPRPPRHGRWLGNEYVSLPRLLGGAKIRTAVNRHRPMTVVRVLILLLIQMLR